MVDSSGNCPQNPWWNDLPGQRCVWLANELHQQYDWPLSVLMQKDVIELETVYAVGNANNTLNQSSFGRSELVQTIRANPEEAIAVALIAAALIPVAAGGAGVGVIASGASALKGLPLWAKLAALGAGSGFAIDATSQAINNMNSCGMDIFHAFYHENLDWGSILRSSGYGFLGGGILSVGGAITTNALLGGFGYLLGTMLYNRLEGNNNLFEGITFENLALNVVSGGILGRLNQLVGGFNLGGGVGLLQNAPWYAQAPVYGMLGYGVVTIQQLLTDDNPLESNEEAFAAGSGSLNAVSIFSGPLGAFLTLLANAVITASGSSADT